jgi:hypothetical protein
MAIENIYYPKKKFYDRLNDNKMKRGSL